MMRRLGFKHRLLGILSSIAALVGAALAAGAGYKH
jgi:hypothetical protein